MEEGGQQIVQDIRKEYENDETLTITKGLCRQGKSKFMRGKSCTRWKRDCTSGVDWSRSIVSARKER